MFLSLVTVTVQETHQSNSYATPMRTLNWYTKGFEYGPFCACLGDFQGSMLFRLVIVQITIAHRRGVEPCLGISLYLLFSVLAHCRRDLK